jgi:hypothetical protein
MPTPRDKDKRDTPTMRPNTRNRNGSLTTPDEFQDIKDATDGRKFLEHYYLLCPPGEPVTNEAMSICLHQISGLAGIPKKAINAIRAAAFLLEELVENATNETVKNAFDSQITEFTSDMKLLIEDVNTKIDNHLKDAISQFTIATEKAATQAENTNRITQGTPNQRYSSALINPPPNVNPRLAAREGIKARQFVLLGIQESPVALLDNEKLKAKINKITKELGLTEGKIRSLVAQRDESVLIEVDSDVAATWYTNVTNRVELCSQLGEEVTFRARMYSVIAYNAPLHINPENEDHRTEINEVNDLGVDNIRTMRWAKPINRRSPQQRSAHLILSFSSVESANRAITNGIEIFHKKCHVERIKKEPLRCLKCQGWNHMAKECTENESTCSNCAEKHRTVECPQPRRKRCVSCKTDEHASWSRECPTFLRKVEDYNERNPDNVLPYFPTTDPWTWSTGNTNKLTADRNNYAKESDVRFGKQKTVNNRDPTRNYDVHNLEYNGRSGHLDYDQRPPSHLGWWDEEPTGTRCNATQTTRQNGQIKPTTTLNSNAIAGPSNRRPSPTINTNTYNSNNYANAATNV